MTGVYKGPEHRSTERTHYECMRNLGVGISEGIQSGIKTRVQGVLSGNCEQADFSPSAAGVLKADDGNILSRRGAITVNSGEEDVYGRAFVYDDDHGDFEESPVPEDGFLRVRRLPFRSFPAKPGDSDALQEKVRQGTLPFVYTALSSMAIAAHTQGEWTKPQIVPVGSIEKEPLADRYGQVIFGGNQVYTLEDGRVIMFRPDVHAERFWRNADRMMMPTMTTEELVAIDEEMIRANWDFVPPPGTARIYLSPGLRASKNILGVEKNPGFIFTCVAAPVGALFAKKPLNLWVNRDFHRAAKGGMGNVKAGGNYGQVLRVTSEVQARGFDDSLFIDNEDRDIREQRDSNSFFVTGDGILRTPPLSLEILDGVTRDSILNVGRELLEKGKLNGVREDEIPVSELVNMREAFACGTGVTIAPIGSITDREDRFEMDVSEDGMGPITRMIHDHLREVMTCKHIDPRYYEGWLHEVRR